MRGLFSALSLMLLAPSAAIAGQTVWLDVSLDEQGQATEAVVVGELHPALVDPAYPRTALLSGQEGWVKVGFKILPTGRTSDVEVLESSHRVFEPPAVRAVRQWRFHAATVDGEAVGNEVVRTIEFKAH